MRRGQPAGEGPSWGEVSQSHPRTPTRLRVHGRSGAYLLEAAHKVVANWRSGQVGCARAPANVEEVIRAEHSIVLLRVPCGGENPIH